MAKGTLMKKGAKSEGATAGEFMARQTRRFLETICGVQAFAKVLPELLARV